MQSLETLTERDFDSVWGDYGGEFSAGRETIQGGAEKDTGCLLVSLVWVPCTWELMAFLAVWEFDTFLFVEHFAVRKSCRNGGLGAVLLTQLTAQCRRAGHTGGGTADR